MMNLTTGFATSNNSQPLTHINQFDLEDLCGDGSVDSSDTLNREPDNEMYIEDREEDAREQTYEEGITSTKIGSRSSVS